MNKNDEFNKKVLYAVAHLQEFYDRRVMLRFFHACDEQDCDIGEAFLFIENELNKSMAEGKATPSFDEIAAMYATSKDWIFDIRSIAVGDKGTSAV